MPEGRPIDPLIEASAIDVELGGRRVINGVSMAVGSGEVVALIGPNGAGKTTLVRVLLGLMAPSQGSVRRRPSLGIGYMPQRMTIDPALPLSVERLLRLALSARASAKTRIREVLDEVGAGHLESAAVQELSGGELQRVFLARALLREPELLVLDEPVQGVDIAGQAELYGLIARIRERRNCGVLMVSHDLHLVMASTDRVICLNHHVCCAGHPETVSRDPAFVALFGPHAVKSFAVYHHHHDHRHDTHGDVVPVDEKTGTGAHG